MPFIWWKWTPSFNLSIFVLQNSFVDQSQKMRILDTHSKCTKLDYRNVKMVTIMGIYFPDNFSLFRNWCMTRLQKNCNFVAWSSCVHSAKRIVENMCRIHLNMLKRHSQKTPPWNNVFFLNVDPPHDLEFIVLFQCAFWWHLKWGGKSTLSVKWLLFELERPHTIGQESNHIKYERNTPPQVKVENAKISI